MKFNKIIQKGKTIKVKDIIKESDEDTDGPLNCFFCDKLIINNQNVRYCDSCDYIKAHSNCVPFE